MRNFFELRGKYSKNITIMIEILGFLALIGLWQLVITIGGIPSYILPSPFQVLKSIKEMHLERGLILNTLFSIKINCLGYIFAVLISVPLGLLLGLNKFCKAFFSRVIEGLRFIPLSAITILFIAWFGIESKMKIAFLAFGIVVYLLPTVVQRVQDVDQVYVDTLKTLGFNNWQIIRNVFIPYTCSKVFEDIRVLVAISWTYIIIAEMLNKSNGIGSLIFIAQRQSRIDMVFGLLVIIMLIGFVQDKMFIWLDKMLFAYKYDRSEVM